MPKKGYKLTEEHRQKLSLLKKGIKPKNFYEMQKLGWLKSKGRPSWNKGLKGVFSQETLKKMSLARLGKYTQENHPNWKGGREAKLERQRIKKRVPRICNECSQEYFIIRNSHSSLRWCKKCVIVIYTCSGCKKHCEIKRKEFTEGRGKFCNILCYRKNTKLKGAFGEKHNRWKGGMPVIAYRARKRGAKGRFTKKQWEELKTKYNFTCLSCRKSEPEIKLSADHVVPLTKGGTNYISNIQPLCRPCNSSKSTKTINYTNV